MRKLIYGTLISLAAVLAGCSDEMPGDGVLSLEGSVPVEFSVEDVEQMFATRALGEVKQLFDEGDLIHIQGEFTGADGAKAKAYGAMQLKNRKWEPVTGAAIYWPYDAEKGTFTAYHLYDSNGMMPKGTITPNVMLSDVQDGQDPLEAIAEDVPYGYAVNLRFRHACTYLTLEKMEQNVTDYYWMVCPGETPIRNAYNLSLTSSGELSLNFVSVGDPAHGGLVYISRPSESMTADDGNYSCASFFLAPGDYSYFDLRTNNNFPFMSFMNSLTEELQANHPYTLNVSNAKGSNFVTTTQTEWDDNGEAWSVDVSKFLESVSKGEDYSELDPSTGEEVPILRRANGVLNLMRNLDFNFFEGYGQMEFTPNVSNSTVFDGNMHYISNIAYPVFRFNYGTIQNLGLRNLKFDITAFSGPQDYDFADDFSRIGGLCLWNRSDARILNIRLEDFDMTVKIQARNSQQTGSNENFHIGAVCGENWSIISGVALKGNFSIKAEPRDLSGEYSYVDANVNIGGIVGNHTLYLSDVGPEPGETFSLTIENTCKGRPEWGSGVFCHGGVVGQSTANEISQVVIPTVTMKLGETECYQEYTGGLVGRLRGTNYLMSNCTVQGSLTSGSVKPYAATARESFSYIGGIAGNVRGYVVNNCRAVCSIAAGTGSAPEATCATGGAFGRLQQGAVIESNSAFGTTLTGPDSYIGDFAGIAQPSITQETLQAAGNSARNLGYPFVGAQIEDTETSAE